GLHHRARRERSRDRARHRAPGLPELPEHHGRPSHRSEGLSVTPSPPPGRIDPVVMGEFERFLGPVVRRMWPGTVSGLDRLPEHDRFLLVANHSGMGIAEIWALLIAWHEQTGGRPIAGMAHPAGFKVPLVRRFLQGFGAVEATREGAAHARAAGAPLLLFPG